VLAHGVELPVRRARDAALHVLRHVREVRPPHGLAVRVELEARAAVVARERAVLGEQLRAQGLTNAAIREAIHVAAVFNVYDRLADALGWEVPVDASFRAGAKFLMKNGYDL
jgi:alkylhydroperoxidase family enzyme